MDNSKMATVGTKIKYDINKETWNQDGMSREVKQHSNFGCDCEYGKECTCLKSLDDTLNPPKVDEFGCEPCRR